MTHGDDLTGRTAIVVGASHGLGRGIAMAFARAGAPVIAVARSEAELHELARSVGDIRRRSPMPVTPRSLAASSSGTSRRP